jgi:hypothetical protein
MSSITFNVSYNFNERNRFRYRIISNLRNLTDLSQEYYQRIYGFDKSRITEFLQSNEFFQSLKNDNERCGYNVSFRIVDFNLNPPSHIPIREWKYIAVNIRKFLNHEFQGRTDIFNLDAPNHWHLIDISDCQNEDCLNITKQEHDVNIKYNNNPNQVVSTNGGGWATLADKDKNFNVDINELFDIELEVTLTLI